MSIHRSYEDICAAWLKFDDLRHGLAVPKRLLKLIWPAQWRLSSMPVRRLNDAATRIMQLHTENLMLVLQSTEDILAWVDVLDAATWAEISPDWLARIRTSSAPDPWTHSFTIIHRASGAIIGSCAYKGHWRVQRVIRGLRVKISVAASKR